MQGYVLGVGMAGIDQVCEGENFKRGLRVLGSFIEIILPISQCTQIIYSCLTL